MKQDFLHRVLIYHEEGPQVFWEKSTLSSTSMFRFSYDLQDKDEYNEYNKRLITQVPKNLTLVER